MKKLICVFLVFLVLFTPYNSLATAKEDIILIQKDVIESNMALLNENLSIGWEFVSNDGEDVLYSLYTFEEGVKADYAVDFVLTDDGMHVEGFNFYMFIDPSNEEVDHFLQIYDFISIMVWLIDNPDSVVEWTNLTQRFYECALDYLGEDTESTYYWRGENHSFLNIEFSSQLSAIKLSVYLGNRQETEKTVSYTEKYKEVAPQIVSQATIIYKEPDAVELYLGYFDRVWGKLIESEGKVVYSTLTQEQKSLVNYPDLNFDKVYFTNNSKSYHSTDMCYTLLRSETVYYCTLNEAQKSKFAPCSKCVR